MKNKQRLVQLLEECIKLETEAIALYTQHFGTPDFFEGVPAEDGSRVRKALQALADDARSHKGIFETLLSKIQDGPQDVH